MFFQPAILALLLASGLGLAALLVASPWVLQLVRHWDLRSGSDEARIDGAIAATRDFFERMGIKTRLRDYVADARIDALLAKLEEHGMTALGEHGDIDLAQSRHIYEAAW